MPYQKCVPGRLVLSESCHPILNAAGKAAYWLIAEILLLIIFSGAILWHWGGGMGDKESPSVVALDRNDVRHLPHHYKIERPAKPPVETVVPGAPRQAGDAKPLEGPRTPSANMEVAAVQSPETAGPTDRQTASPPLERDQQPVEAVSKDEPITDRKELDGETQDGGDGFRPEIRRP